MSLTAPLDAIPRGHRREEQEMPYLPLGPLPTKRRARYVFRRKRYIRKARRAWANWVRIERHNGGNPIMRRATDWHLQGSGAKQQPPGLRKPAGSGPLVTGLSPLFSRTVSTAHRRKPPIARLFYAGFPYHTIAGRHHRLAIHGYHQRRVKWRGRKLHPKTDGRRRPRAIKYASRLFAETGFYPGWDPLGRTPVEPTA